MIVDRISLNLAVKYLTQFQQNEGPVIDILFAYKDQLNKLTKTIKFPDMETLVVFVAKYAPLVEFTSIDCTPTHLYELRSFTVIKNNTDKNYIYQDGQYITLSNNINKFSLTGLNTTYTESINEIKGVFLGLKINEYILNQTTYIDCGYIEEHAPGTIEKLKTIYNKYKQI